MTQDKPIVPLSDAELKAVRARAKDAELGALGAMFTVAREDVPRLIAELTACRKAGREMNGAIDAMWNDDYRGDNMTVHMNLISESQQRFAALLPPEEPKP